MPLFDDTDRTEQRSKRENESLFGYYNSSARRCVAALRDLLESWFQGYPETAKPDLQARFRSPIAAQHQGAFFELYLHELLSSMGFALTVHPDLENTAPTHPDFVLSRDGQEQFYLEATSVLPSEYEVAKERMIAEVYDTLNKMRSPNFFVAIRVQGTPTTAPRGRELRDKLERWLATLNPDELGRKLETEGFDGLPSFEWTHEGLNLSFLPIAKSPGLRGKPGVRPIGSTMPEARMIDSHSPIRNAISTKATKYGELSLPYVVAVNVMDMFAHDIDIMAALFGRECITAYRGPNGETIEKLGRQPNGAWLGPRGPQSTRVSAALVATNLSPWAIGSITPVLIHHPWASKPIAPEMWQLTQQVPNTATGHMEERLGSSASDFLALPTPWPVPDDSFDIQD